MDDDDNPNVAAMNELARFVAWAAVIAALIMVIAVLANDANDAILRSVQ